MRHKFLFAAFLIAVLAGVGVWSKTNLIQAAPRQPFSALFPASEDFQFDPPVPGSYPLHKVKDAPDGAVIDIKGQTHRLSELTDGKISLVSFVYLTCGDVNGCPLAMSVLYEIHDTSIALPQLQDDVQLLTVSFDPERDTVEAIDSFAYPITSDENAEKKFDWHVLTTSGMSDLQPILDGYGQVVDRSDDQEQISHLLRMFLVDRDGVIRNVYGLGFLDPRLLMTDIETLLMQESHS